jgi:hypothetical protein
MSGIKAHSYYYCSVAASFSPLFLTVGKPLPGLHDVLLLRLTGFIVKKKALFNIQLSGCNCVMQEFCCSPSAQSPLPPQKLVNQAL